MSYSIEWSEEAEVTYTKILLYLEEKWTEREVNNFMTRTEEILSFVEENPLLYPHSQKQEVHRAVVSSQSSLYYEIYKNKIVLLSLLTIVRILRSGSINPQLFSLPFLLESFTNKTII